MSHTKLLKPMALCLMLVACGSGYKEHKDDRAPAAEPSFKLAEGNAFGARLQWLNGPQTCTDKTLQSTAVLSLLTPEGKTPATVTDVTVKPWMKVHGHGTGNWQPTITERGDQSRTYDITGICFIMAGPWELNIEATVDGLHGKLEWSVEVP